MAGSHSWKGSIATPRARVHISTMSLITRFCWQCHVLPAAMSKTASRTGARVLLPLPDLWRSESQLHASKRLQDPGTFFPNLQRALRWKRPLVVCWTLRSDDELQRHWKRKRRSPGEINVKCIGQDRLVPCRCGFIRARLDFPVFAGTLPSRQRPGPRLPNRDVWVRTVRKSRPPFSKQSGSFDQTSYLWRSFSFSLFFFFFFFHLTFFRNGQGQTPLPKTGMPVFWQMRKFTDGPLGTLLMFTFYTTSVTRQKSSLIR